MELVSLAPGVWLLPGTTNLGVIEGEDGVVAVDAGLDKEYGRRLRRALEARGWSLRQVWITHAHADHFGGADYLVRNLGAQVWAPPLEAAVVENPLLEPLYLFAGASPLPNLRSKWLLARPAPVSGLLRPDAPPLGGAEVGILPLPGHSPGQVGVAVRGVLFCADALFGPRVLETYRVPFAYDVGQQLESLERLRDRIGRDRVWVPAHGEPLRSPREQEAVLEANRAAVERAAAFVLDALPGTTEGVVARTAAALEFRWATVAQYVLFRTTVLAHLSRWVQEKRVRVHLTEEGLRWELVG